MIVIDEIIIRLQLTVADLKGARGTSSPSRGLQILSIPYSFGQNLAKSYVGAPPGRVGAPLGEILDPPLTCSEIKIHCDSLITQKSHPNNKLDKKTTTHISP